MSIMSKIILLILFFVCINILALNNNYEFFDHNQISLARTYINVSGHVDASDTEESISGAEVILAGETTYNAVTDNDGNFTLTDVISDQQYNLTIHFAGYQTYTNDSVYVDSVDLCLGNITLLEIAYPAQNVIAAELEEGIAEIHWSPPDTTVLRCLESYSLYRLLEGNQNDPITWTEIATEVVDTIYIDPTWGSVDPGEYRYAVIAVYSNNVTSEPAFSINYNPYYCTVTYNVTTDSGDESSGAEITLTNTDGFPDPVYTSIVPASGTVEIPWVIAGIYDVSVNLDNFETYQETDIMISESSTFTIELSEILYPPEELTIEDIQAGVLLHWIPYSVYLNTPDINNLRHVMHFNVYLDNEFYDSTEETQYLISGINEGSHIFGVSAYYSSGHESEIISTEMYVVSNDDMIPFTTELQGNYPNPFNPTTAISFSVVEAGNVTLDIYNIKGEKVKTLVDGYMEPNFYNIQWNGNDDNNHTVASGVYFYKMKAGRYTSTKKMILMK